MGLSSSSLRKAKRFPTRPTSVAPTEWNDFHATNTMITTTITTTITAAPMGTPFCAWCSQCACVLDHLTNLRRGELPAERGHRAAAVAHERDLVVDRGELLHDCAA